MCCTVSLQDSTKNFDILTDTEETKFEEELDAKQTSVSDSTISHPLNAWLACRLELENFDLKDETFTISGYINIFWKWDGKNDPKMAKILLHKVENKNGIDLFLQPLKSAGLSKDACDSFKSRVPNYVSLMEMKSFLDDDGLKELNIDKFEDRVILLRAMKNMPIQELNDLDDDASIIQVQDVRDFDWKDKLPLPPDNPFHLSTVVELEHLQPPSLRYNRVTGDCHSIYHIKATLFEQFELFAFPFDFQFLDIKLWWDHHKFRLIHDDITDNLDDPWISALDSESEQDQVFIRQIEEEIGVRKAKRRILAFMKRMLALGCKQADIQLLHSWMYFDYCEEYECSLAWIRLRIKRAPIYHVMTSLFPMTLIVCCSFGAFEFEDVGDALNYAITVLLTFVAQQTFIQHLPPQSEMLFVHHYTLMGYLVQAGVIAWVILLGGGYGVGAFVIMGVWAFVILMYLALWLKWCFIVNGKWEGEIRDKSVSKVVDETSTRDSYFCCVTYKRELCLTWREKERRERYEWLHWQKEFEKGYDSYELKVSGI